MSRTALRCDECGRRLGWIRPNGKVRVDPNVPLVATQDCGVRLSCLSCGTITKREGIVVWIVPPKHAA